MVFFHSRQRLRPSPYTPTPCKSDSRYISRLFTFGYGPQITGLKFDGTIRSCRSEGLRDGLITARNAPVFRRRVRPIRTLKKLEGSIRVNASTKESRPVHDPRQAADRVRGNCRHGSLPV